MKPRLLDLFCGAGGCSVGYMQAGFEVVGVDIAPQKNYPYEFHQADALTFPLDGFDVIHASPVCKGYTELNYAGKEKHERLILPVKERLRKSGKIFIIENVSGARLELPGSLTLCGSMFGLPIRRHRLFESNILLFAPHACQHDRDFYSIHGHHVWNRAKRSLPRKDGRWRPGYATFDEGAQAMGIDWMVHKELTQAIPPAYTAWIGGFLLDAVLAERQVAI